jgi:hypothetical protein
MTVLLLLLKAALLLLGSVLVGYALRKYDPPEDEGRVSRGWMREQERQR